MLIVAYSIFNEIDVIEQSVRSVMPLASHFIIVDGAYEDYPSEIDYSTDGTIEKIQSLLGDRATIIQAPRLRELEKRTLYLFAAQKQFTEKDWILVIDGDDVFEGDAVEIQHMMENPNISLGQIGLYHPDTGRSGQGTRFFKLSIPRLHYWRSHYELWDADGRFVTHCYPSMVLQHCRLISLRSKRSPERNRKADQYLDSLPKFETKNFSEKDHLERDPYTKTNLRPVDAREASSSAS